MVKKLKFNAPFLLKGNVTKDKKGSVGFVNKFKFSKIKRFYVIDIKKKGIIRAWHGHRHEEKYAFVISGKVLIGAVRIRSWKNPPRKTKVKTFILSSEEPAILCIPKGYANGFKSLTSNAKLIFFSTSTLEQSKKDDIRFDTKYWDIWS